VVDLHLSDLRLEMHAPRYPGGLGRALDGVLRGVE
jgi:hypothetical protein